MICRTCSKPMGLKVQEGQTLDICQGCGATWIDKNEVAPLLQQPESPVSPEELMELKQDLEWASQYDDAPSRLCPRCGKKMPRQVFAALSGIKIDYCPADGIWCDPGELERLTDFVSKGGLQLARLKNWEKALHIEPTEKDVGIFPRLMKTLGQAASLFSAGPR